MYYLDGNYRLHVENAEGLTPWEDAEGIFAGKCARYIEGYRVVPAGRRWVREDGVAFAGEMIAPAVPLGTLLALQAASEQPGSET